MLFVLCTITVFSQREIKPSEIVIGVTYDIEKADFTEAFKKTLPKKKKKIIQGYKTKKETIEQLVLVKKANEKKGQKNKYKKEKIVIEVEDFENPIYAEYEVNDIVVPFALPRLRAGATQLMQDNRGKNISSQPALLYKLDELPPFGTTTAFAFDGEKTYRWEGEWIANNLK